MGKENRPRLVALTASFLWSCRESKPLQLNGSRQTPPRRFLYARTAALSLVITALIVAGNQRVLPRAVGIPSAISPLAIA